MPKPNFGYEDAVAGGEPEINLAHAWSWMSIFTLDKMSVLIQATRKRSGMELVWAQVR